jgi:ribokinase
VVDRPGVVVVGSVNTDMITTVPRLPKPGETVLGGQFRQAGGGKGANQAIAAARLGAPTWLVGATGDDVFGAAARAELSAEGVDLTFLAVASEPTGIAQILIGEDGENMIAVASGANASITGQRVGEAVLSLAQPGWVVLANLEVPDGAVQAAAEAAAECGASFILNPAPARRLPRDLFALCDVLTPNEHEVEHLCRSMGIALGPEALLALGVPSVIVTLGPAGAALYRGGSMSRQSPPTVVPVDTTGAGDAFNGALAWAMTEGMGVEDALRVAVTAGALNTQAVGARSALPSFGEVMVLLMSSADGEEPSEPSIGILHRRATIDRS